MTNEQVDWESFVLGVAWGVLLVVALGQLALWWGRRAPRPVPPPDPFNALRWQVLECAREATRDAAQ